MPKDPYIDDRQEAPRWRGLATEARHPESGRLDALSSEQVVALVLDEDRRGLEAARRHSAEIARAADWLARSLEAGGRVVLAGAGTSGRLGILEAAECPPTFGTDPDRIRGVIAGDEEAVFQAREGAEDNTEEGRRAAAGLGGSDLLVGISASSVTPFVRAALGAARRGGVRTILVTCSPPQGLAGLADLVLALDTGPEVLTGSTRLKAGSVTKAVLNAMTTAAMARIGKVFENLMVDLTPGSGKLRDRALRIIEAGGRVSFGESQALLDAAGGDVKTAIVMARCGVAAKEARARLAAAGGRVRKAIENRDAPGGAGDGAGGRDVP